MGRSAGAGRRPPGQSRAAWPVRPPRLAGSRGLARLSAPWRRGRRRQEGGRQAPARGRRLPDGPAARRAPPVRQLDAQPLAVPRVRHEGLAVAVLARTLTHVLQAGLVVQRGVHLAVARLEDRRAESVAQPAAFPWY